MGPGQVAVVWMMHDQQQAAEAAKRAVRPASQRSFAARFNEAVRRFAHRSQLGPVAGNAAA